MGPVAFHSGALLTQGRYARIAGRGPPRRISAKATWALCGHLHKATSIFSAPIGQVSRTECSLGNCNEFLIGAVIQTLLSHTLPLSSLSSSYTSFSFFLSSFPSVIFVWRILTNIIIYQNLVKIFYYTLKNDTTTWAN